jgi:hypothetical protein
MVKVENHIRREKGEGEMTADALLGSFDKARHGVFICKREL